MRADVVYIVGPQPERQESLRYSLRSLDRNGGPARKVWIVGTVPAWVRNVEALPLEPLPDKFANQRKSIETACAAVGMSPRLVLFNDDHFVTDPLGNDWPAFHLGPTSEYVRHLLATRAVGERNTWLDAVRSTAAWMAGQGHGDVLAYEAHVPLLFDRDRLAGLLEAYPTEKRLAVGEMYAAAGAGGEGVDAGNAKVQHLEPAEFHAKLAHPLPYLSSNAETFGGGLVGGYIRGMFREPSRFEEG